MSEMKEREGDGGRLTGALPTGSRAFLSCTQWIARLRSRIGSERGAAFSGIAPSTCVTVVLVLLQVSQPTLFTKASNLNVTLHSNQNSPC